MQEMLFFIGHAVEVHLKILPVLLHGTLQLQSRKERLDGGYHGKTAHNQRGEFLDRSLLQIPNKNRPEESQGNYGQQQGNIL